jgi:hypothetical protein
MGLVMLATHRKIHRLSRLGDTDQERVTDFMRRAGVRRTLTEDDGLGEDGPPEDDSTKVLRFLKEARARIRQIDKRRPRVRRWWHRALAPGLLLVPACAMGLFVLLQSRSRPGERDRPGEFHFEHSRLGRWSASAVGCVPGSRLGFHGFAVQFAKDSPVHDIRIHHAPDQGGRIEVRLADEVGTVLPVFERDCKRWELIDNRTHTPPGLHVGEMVLDCPSKGFHGWAVLCPQSE